MLSTDDLDAAVEAGVLDDATRRRLLLFADARTGAAADPDSERFRLLTGFNDIFVSLACLLLLGSLVALLPGALAAAAIVMASWLLAEYFTRRRRMALPSILLLLAFVGGVFALLVLVLTSGDYLGTAFQQMRMQGMTAALWAPVAVSGAGAVAAAVVHWRRFRVPITLAAGAAAVAIAGLGLVGMVAPMRSVLLLSTLLLGLAIFAVAMRYDMRDRARISRDTDIAFWLHLLAAPMIVHPVFVLSGLSDAAGSIAGAAAVLAVYAALTLVALAIDRRALLVSALLYVLWALQGLFEAGRVAAGFGLTALILGSFLVMLSAAWGGLRRRLVARLPAAWASALPEPA